MNDIHQERGGFFGLTVGRPVALMVLFVTLIVIGLIGYQRIPLALLPSGFSEPSLFIWIGNPGASAQENEERIARVIEEQLRTLTGIENLENTSSEGEVFFRIAFDGTVDMDLAKAEVRDRLERARPQMPSTAENAFIWTESAADLPITFFGITLRGDPDERDYYIEKIIKPRLDAVQGIGRVDLWGVLQDSVRILLSEEKVTAANLDLGTLIGRLSQDNFAMPMGELDDGGSQLLLRSDMRFKSLEEIEDYPIGSGLKISDVGEVARVKSVGDSLSRIDGGYAYYGMATMDSQSNVVVTSNNFRTAMEELKEDPAMDGKMSYLLFFLQGDMIEGALAQLRETATWGGLLAVAVLFIFLRRIRLTLCVALSIPISVLMALLWEYAWGGTFNVLTMAGITLGIGMLVDNAVVVVESIARERAEGRSTHGAAVVGSRQIALAITLATLTTVVVFLPLIFMTDNRTVRVLFGGLGIPLVMSLLASLLVAVVFLPVITARLLGERVGPVAAAANVLAPLMRLPVRGIAWLIGGARLLWYYFVRGLFLTNRALLTVFAPLRWIVVLGILGLVAWRLGPMFTTAAPHASLAEFGLGGPMTPQGPVPPIVLQAISAAWVLAVSLVPIAITIFALKRWRRRSARPPSRPAYFVPAGDSLVDMAIRSNQLLVEWTMRNRFWACVLALVCLVSIFVPLKLADKMPMTQEAYQNEINFRVDFNDDFTLEEAAEEVGIYEEFVESKREDYGFDHWSNRFDETDAQLTMYFDRLPGEDRIKELQRALREDLPRIPGHTLRFYDRENVSDRSSTITTFVLHGPDAAELERLGREAIDILEEVPGLSQISSDLEHAPEQIRVEVDRELASGLAVSTQTIQQTISYVLAGFPLPRYQEKGRDIPLLIEYDEEEVAGLPTLRDLNVFGESGMVPLSSVASLSFSKGSQRIRRVNGKISFTIWAEVDDPLRILALTEAGYASLAQMELPRGYAWGLEDSALARQESEFSEIWKAFFLSVVLVFLLMAILFESLLRPFSVLFTVPFAALGAYWTLYLTGTPIDVMGIIGLIILAGVVVNNGIILVDRIHALRTDGLARTKAVVMGCGQRVRPVLMTALSTVCGLFPMIVTEPPPNSFDYRTLATVVAGGLVASTFFTLWVVPLCYTLIDDFTRICKDHFLWWLRKSGAPFESVQQRLAQKGAAAQPVEMGGVDSPR